jgi:hypothetical protein
MQLKRPPSDAYIELTPKLLDPNLGEIAPWSQEIREDDYRDCFTLHQQLASAGRGWQGTVADGLVIAT